MASVYIKFISSPPQYLLQGKYRSIVDLPDRKSYCSIYFYEGQYSFLYDSRQYFVSHIEERYSSIIKAYKCVNLG